MSNPEQIERDLATTRDSLGNDVGQLREKTAPSTIVTPRVNKLKSSATTMKDRLMGAKDNGEAKDKAADLAGTAKDKADALSSKVSDAAGNAPAALKEQAQGNPLAAGLIAFGVGWLLSSLAPASSAETKAAKHIEDNAGAVVDPLKDSAQEIAGNLQQPLQEAAEDVKSTATDAANKTTDHAKSAAQDVQKPLTQ